MMLAKIKTFLTQQDSFLRNVAVLSSASVVAQVINVLSMPLFSRLYSPSDFGTLALFSSVVGLLATVSGFRYYLVIPLARTDRYLHSLIWTSFIFQSICVVLIVIMVEVASRFMAGTAYAVLIPYRFLIPLGVLCVGIYSLLTQWAIRTKEFSLIAKTKLTQTFARAAITLILGLSGIKPLGLLLGNILGQSYGSTSLLCKLIRGSKKIQLSRTHITRTSIYYRKMFIYETPGAFLNMSGSYLLPIIMAYFFVPNVVGSFAMSQQVLGLPSAIIGASIGQVFVQKASEAKKQGNVSSLMLNTMILLVRIGVFPILAIGLTSPIIFTVILGPEWLEAGRYTQILAPWLALNFVYSPLSMIYTIMMFQRFAFIFVSIYTFLRLLSVYIGRNDPILTMVLLSFSGSLCMILGIFIPSYLLNVNKTKFLKNISKLLIELLFELLPIFILLMYINDLNIVTQVFLLILSVVIYVFILINAYNKI